jgi:hypothetical protein
MWHVCTHDLPAGRYVEIFKIKGGSMKQKQVKKWIAFFKKSIDYFFLGIVELDIVTPKKSVTKWRWIYQVVDFPDLLGITEKRYANEEEMRKTGEYGRCKLIQRLDFTAKEFEE